MKLGKKLLSLLTVLCLTLSLFPTMALAADGKESTGSPATSVYVGSTTLSVGNYLTSNGTVTTSKPDEDTGYIHFSTNGQLTLNNYIGSSKISITGNLTINLVGTNKITTSGNNSIYSDGELTIMSSSKGSLTAENPTSGSAQTTIYSTSNITITGNATVTATINGTAQAINSNSANGTITIADHATVTAVNEYSDSTTTGTDSIAILAGSGNDKAHPTGTIEVKDSATLTAKGYGKALACQTFTVTGYTVKASADYNATNPGEYVAESLATYKYITATPAVDKYNVWVGGTQITSANKDDVLGNSGTPTVTYDPTTKTLTLNNAVIDFGSTRGIKASNDDLEIDLKGENKLTGTDNLIYLETNGKKLTITSAEGDNGTLTLDSVSENSTVYVNGDLTIAGYATVTATNGGTAQVLHSPSGNITITDHAKVIAKNTRTLETNAHSVALLTGTYDTSSPTGTIKVEGSASLLAQGSTQALKCETFTADGLTTEVSKNYTGANPETNYSNLANYKYVHVHPASDIVSYDVWVGDTLVTSQNKNNVLNDDKVTYDPDSKTLTLNNATITGAPNRQYTSTIKDACGIYAKHDLTVALVGTDNKINTDENLTAQTNGSYGIFVDGRLTFIDGRTDTTGSTPSITVSGGKSNNSGNAWVPGVYASGITVNNCNVTAMGGTASDSYPVAYAMSKAPTLVGAKVVKASTTNSADGVATTYDKSSISRYKYLKIEKTTEEDTTVAAPVITPESGYFTGSSTVTITCPTSGAKVYYTTSKNSTRTEYTAPIPLSETTTITAIAVKDGKNSEVVEAKFTKRAENADAVTAVTLNLSEHTRSMKVGDLTSEPLIATVKHENSEISGLTVTWESDNPEVATVENGVITAKSVGKARVTAAVVENGVTYSDFCDVVVEARPSSSHHSSSSTTYYDVNAAVSGEGGSVAAGTKRASRGTTVTVTATAASGYQVAQVSAVDKDGKTVSLTDKGDGVYTFVMPASKVDVTACFAQVQKPEEKDPYGDVSKDSYYYDAVKWAAETGVTTGVGDGLFAPEWVCTRGQIVTFLWRASGSPAPKATELPFTDVAADAYYAQAVLWAVENGITNGTSETTFSPDQTCTRAHAVAFLYRMSGSPAAAGSTFSDVAADAYYSTAVAWAVEKGITNGTSGTTFSPDDTCTRGQIVTFLYRLAQTK